MNPYDELGKRLAGAVAASGRRRSRRAPTLTVLLAALVLGGGGAATAATLLTGGPDAAERAAAVIGRATEQTSDEPICRRLAREKQPRLVAGTAPAPLLSRLGVLRRPQTTQERRTRRGLLIGGQFTLAATVRLARAADGTTFLLFLSRGGLPGFDPVDPVGCATRIRDVAVGLADPDLRERVRTRAQRDVDRASKRSQDGGLNLSFVTSVDRYGRRIGGGAAGQLPKSGEPPKISTIGQGGRGKRRFVVLTGLLPDGVTEIRVRDRDPGAGGRRTPPRRYAVRDNVYSVELPKGMGPRLTVEWLDAAGRVLEATHPRF